MQAPRKKSGFENVSVSSISDLLHLHKTTVKSGPASAIGQTLRSEHIDVSLVGGELGPTGGRSADDSGGHATIHCRLKNARPAPVVNAHGIGRPNAQARSIGEMHVERPGFAIGMRAVAERRVHAVVIL